VQWTTVLDILEWFLHERGLTYVRLDGSTAVADRLTIVDAFNDPNGGVFAFLLSTRAGGQGLNLTGADTVILHDVDFNPQVTQRC
jgi:SWI/SNF-related matrix-associated actin-dependent regulator 1 of chromatin subfamily A